VIVIEENQPDWSLIRFDPQDYGDVLAMNLQLFPEDPDYAAEAARRMVTERAPSLYYGMYVGRQLVGDVSLTGVENCEGHLSSDILPNQRHKGYATWAARTMASYAFTSLGLEELVTSARTDNEYSQKVLERTGFTFVREVPKGWSWYRLSNPNS
jgi:RimJ/RimL family protein N-acetyltransferase